MTAGQVAGRFSWRGLVRNATVAFRCLFVGPAGVIVYVTASYVVPSNLATAKSPRLKVLSGSSGRSARLTCAKASMDSSCTPRLAPSKQPFQLVEAV
jgi:hypothetical protein